jgi:hypothetical protein
MFALAGMVGAVVATPIAVYASHRFTDVPGSNTFHADIEWLKDNGITFGCNPPANTKYCPDDLVTRGQMAAFLKRLSEKKVVDAATAVNATNATNADNATNAGKVDGFSANQLLRVAFGSTENAPDSDGNVVPGTITAPKAGWLILSASIEALAFGTSGDFYTCQLTVDGGTVAGSSRASTVHFAGSGHTQNNNENCSTTGVHQVTAGTHTFALTIVGRDGFALFGDATVWALFVPFDGNGNRP